MTLISLKHTCNWGTVARVFKIPHSSFQEITRKFMDVVSPFLYEKFVEDMDDRWVLDKLVRSGHAFTNSRKVGYATDAIFQQANKSNSNMNAIPQYYSGKHHLYYYKVEVSVLPNGLATKAKQRLTQENIERRMLEGTRRCTTDGDGNPVG
ncbi:hypothetical protein L917_08970 [Phytophthora nicotianae]|uniref:Uncharacterized protein n=1 Tax=Phytophthora nicotianae TaxID=4792 RepID=W2L5Q5_PHYNI|nr:hypothetical protein L917_08970 [Phytophthora nicotianae]